MLIPSSWLKLTGWRAVLVAVPIVALIVFKVWNATPHYRQFGVDSIELAAGKAWISDFEIKRDRAVRVDLAGSVEGGYLLYIVTPKAMKQMQDAAAAGAPIDGIPMLMKRTGHADISVTNIDLKAGTYSVVVEYTGDKPLKGKLTLYEMR